MQTALLQLSIVFAAVYFFSLNGLGALPNLSINFLLKNQIGMSPAQMAYFQAVTLLAWVIKPLWGFVSDCLPIAGSRRKSYLIIASATAGFIWFALAATKNFTAGSLLVFVSVAYMAYAFQDVVTDGLMVEVGKPLNLTGQFQSVQWAAVYIAMIVTSLWGGHLSELVQNKHLSYQAVFAITGIFPLLTVILVTFCIREPKHGHPEKSAENSLKTLLRKKDIWILALFLFFWNFSPSFGAPFFYYSVDTLKFSGAFLGQLQAVASAGALAGSVIYGIWIVKISIRKLLIFAVFAGVAVIFFHYVYFIPALIANSPLLKTISIASNFLFGMMSSLILLTLLNLAAKVSPQYAGGTVFALLMSFYNLGLLGSSALGGLLYPFLGLKLLLLISAVFSLLVLFLMPWLPLHEKLTQMESAIRKIVIKCRIVRSRQ